MKEFGIIFEPLIILLMFVFVLVFGLNALTDHLEYVQERTYIKTHKDQVCVTHKPANTNVKDIDKCVDINLFK